MPKTHGRRIDKARELRRLLADGPSLGMGYETLTPEIAERRVKSWLSSWVIPLVTELVPELKPERAQ
jgi:hypothetical protein